MLDINFIRENKDLLIQNIHSRCLNPEIYNVEKLIALDNEKKTSQQKIDSLRAKRNQMASEMKNLDSSERTSKVEEAKALRKEVKKLEEKFDKIKSEWQSLMDLMPNITHPQMPIGKDEKDNKEIKKWGDHTDFTFPAQDHLTLGENLDLIDVKKSAHISGSRFYYLKNEALILEFALFNWVFQKLVAKGFTPIETPVLVKEKALYGTGYFPSEKNQIYKLENSNQLEDKEDLYLSGTSEQAIVAYHFNDVFLEKNLPQKYVGFSPCFRSEVGSWGKDVRGIKRVHQFNKLEMIFFTTPETSQQYMEEALKVEEEILQELNLPYHVLEMCSGDVGLATYRKWDVEVYLKSQKAYCEVMSNSDLASFHSRRLNIKYQKETGSKDFVHTVSATAVTNTRIILAILDNYQNADGSVNIPVILQNYLGKKIIKVQK